MSHETPRATRSFSPWWLLFIVPAGWGLGWLVAQAPTPATPPVSAPDPSATVVRTSPVARPVPVEARADVDAGGKISQWTTLADAINESGRTGKPVMLDFNAAWCGPCRQMKQQVFEDGGRGAAVQAAVIPVSIVDRYREDGANSRETESLMRQYQVDAFPTLVVFSPTTGRSVTTRGFAGPDATVKWITEAARSLR